MESNHHAFTRAGFQDQLRSAASYLPDNRSAAHEAAIVVDMIAVNTMAANGLVITNIIKRARSDVIERAITNIAKISKRKPIRPAFLFIFFFLTVVPYSIVRPVLVREHAYYFLDGPTPQRIRASNNNTITTVVSNYFNLFVTHVIQVP